MIENFMNPKNLDCRVAFTKGQVEYMRNTLQEFRPELFTIKDNPIPDPSVELIIYPTFTPLELNISFTELDFKIVSYEIFSANGVRLVNDNFAATSHHILDVSTIPSGLHFIQLTYDDKVVMKKFIKV